MDPLKRIVDLRTENLEDNERKARLYAIVLGVIAIAIAIMMSIWVVESPYQLLLGSKLALRDAVASIVTTWKNMAAPPAPRMVDAEPRETAR